MVVDDVEDHFEARAVQRLHHLLELVDLLTPVAGGAVVGVGGEEADAVVAPVVGEAALEQRRLGEELVHRQQLDRGDTEVLEVVGHHRVPETRIGPADLFGDPVVELGEALDVQLVDDGVAPPVSDRSVALPVERRVDDHAAGGRGRGVERARLRGVVDVVRQDLGAGGDRPGDREAVGVEQQLLRVEAHPARRVPRSVDAVAVAGPGRELRQGAVPDAEGVLGEGEPALPAGFVVVVEDAQPHLGGVRRVDREVRRLGRPGRAQWPVPSRPDGSLVTEAAPEAGSHALDSAGWQVPQ